MFAKAVFLLGALWGLAGCGFQPLHAPMASVQNSSVKQAMAELKITTIADREGQILRNHLLDMMNPLGQPTFPKAHLSIRLDQRKETVTIRKDGTTERYRSVIVAHIQLRDAHTSKILLTDTLNASNAYYIGESSAVSAYATNVAERDANEKALRLLADQIYLLIAAYYAREDVSDHAPLQAS